MGAALVERPAARQVWVGVPGQHRAAPVTSRRSREGPVRRPGSPAGRDRRRGPRRARRGLRHDRVHRRRGGRRTSSASTPPSSAPSTASASPTAPTRWSWRCVPSDVRPGGEVILPANTFIATAEAVSRIGAVPVLVDVDDEHLLIDPAAVERAITDRTQAIVPVHLFGQTAPVEAAGAAGRGRRDPHRRGCRAVPGRAPHGRPAGSLGRVAGTSFYPGKNLGAAGDAGAVTTNDAEVAERVRVLGAHGSPTKYVHDVIGMNSRLDTVQAVVPARQAGAAGEVERRCARCRRPLRRAARRRARRPRTAGSRAATRTSGTCTSSGSPTATGCWPSSTPRASAPASTTRPPCT